MIELKNLTFSYRRGSRNVLEEISATLAEGMIHGLLGRNGTGKTTLLKTVCGLLLPQKGSVAVDGENPARRTPSVLGRLMIVPEEFDLPGVPLDTFVRHTAPFYTRFSTELFDMNCRELEVDPRAKCDALSMGQRKRAYLAFALACRTPYLLLDEPVNGLDIPAKAVLRRLLAAAADSGQTIVISTHQVADLQNLIDNVVILDERGIVLNATTAELSRRLRFGVLRAGDEPLYWEESVAGRTGVCENRDASDTDTDLALLFNAATADRDRLVAIMNPKNRE